MKSQQRSVRFQLNDLRRRLYEIHRVGKIIDLDDKNHKAKVQFIKDGTALISEWITWKPSRANKNISWWAPQIGEQVEVTAPFGDPSQAYISGSFYSDDFVAPDNNKSHFTIVFEDGAKLQYDAEKSILSFKTKGDIKLECKNYMLKTDGDISIEAKGNITEEASKNLTFDGKTINIG